MTTPPEHEQHSSSPDLRVGDGDASRPEETRETGEPGTYEPVTPRDEPIADQLDEIPWLGQAMGKGFAWSLLNNFVGKLGSFVVGIVVVRLLTEGEFGTYAVGMVVLTVLLSMNELGVSVAVVQRRGSVRDIAPTVVTISILSSLVLSVVAFVAAPAVASAMQSPESTWLIRLLVVGVVADGFAAVPDALINRAMQQRSGC